MNIRRIIDVLMTVTLMLMMSLQVMSQAAHEYLGVFMFVLFVVHQYLNRRWYGALFKGKYNLRRCVSAMVNITLLCSFVMTAFSGIVMSESFPALNFEDSLSFVRLTHLCCAYLSFVLMGVHLGLHWGMIAGRINAKWPEVLGVIIAGYGLYVFINADIFSYILLLNQFAFIDYDKNVFLALIENISMLSFWTLIGYQLSKILTGKYIKPCIVIACTVIVFAVLRLCLVVPEGMTEAVNW